MLAGGVCVCVCVSLSVCLCVHLFELCRLSHWTHGPKIQHTSKTNLSRTSSKVKAKCQDHLGQKCKNSSFQSNIRKGQGQSHEVQVKVKMQHYYFQHTLQDQGYKGHGQRSQGSLSTKVTRVKVKGHKGQGQSFLGSSLLH